MVDVLSHNPDSLPVTIAPKSALRRLDAGYARLVAVAPPVSSEHYQPINILRLPDVIKRVGLKRAAIYLHIAQGKFPRQISLGGRAVGWLEHEIDTWVAARIDAARGAMMIGHVITPQIQSPKTPRQIQNQKGGD